MTLVMVGFSHRRLSAESLAHAQQVLLPRLPGWLNDCDLVDGSVVLATCNRLELHLDATSYHQVVSAFTEFLDDCGLAELSGALSSGAGSSAVRHLFEVASGLDSAVLGEAEISGQVRAAMAESGRLTPTLRRLFDAALATSKTVSQLTPLGRSGRSIARTGLDLLEGRVGRGSQAVVLGTGSFSRSVISALLARGYRVTQVSLSGRPIRSVHPHVTIAQTLDLTGVELLVSCRGGQRLTATDLLNAGIPDGLTVLDLALGGDLDESARALAHLNYLCLDDLINAPADPTGVAEARQLVAEAVTAFLEAERGRAAAGDVGAIRGHVERIVATEIARATQALDPETAQTVARSLRRVAAALLHTPSVRAAEHARRGELDHYRHALHTVFGPDLSA